MSRRAPIPGLWLAMLKAFALILLLAGLTLFDVYGDKIMKRVVRRVAAAVLLAAVCLPLVACQSVDLEAYARGANDLDPGCFKDVDVQVTPVFALGWVIPVVTGRYRKTCNPDQAIAPQPVVVRGLTPGQVVGAPSP